MKFTKIINIFLNIFGPEKSIWKNVTNTLIFTYLLQLQIVRGGNTRKNKHRNIPVYIKIFILFAHFSFDF